jgi:hypothetical protein
LQGALTAIEQHLGMCRRGRSQIAQQALRFLEAAFGLGERHRLGQLVAVDAACGDHEMSPGRLKTRRITAARRGVREYGRQAPL